MPIDEIARVLGIVLQTIFPTKSFIGFKARSFGAALVVLAGGITIRLVINWPNVTFEWGDQGNFIIGAFLLTLVCLVLADAILIWRRERFKEKALQLLLEPGLPPEVRDAILHVLRRNDE